MERPTSVNPVLVPVVADFLVRLPRLRDADRILSQLVHAAMNSTSSVVGVARTIGRNPVKVELGELDDELRRVEKEWSELLESDGYSSDSRKFVLSDGRSSLGISLQADDSVVCLLLAREGDYEDWQYPILRLLLEGASSGIANITELKDVSRRLEQLDLVHNIGRALNSILDIKELLDRIMEMGRLTMKAAACSVLLVDSKSNELVFEIAQGEAGSALQQFRMPIDAGLAGWIATRGEAVIVGDVSKDPRHYRQADLASGFTTRSLVGAPLRARGKIIGVTEVVNKLDGSEFDSDDLELLTTIAADAAIAIDNARLYRGVVDGSVDTIRALAAAIDSKDPYTRGHSERVTWYSLLAADELGVSREEREALQYAAVLHDVGKIGIDDRILRKPAPLDDEEWELIRTHASLGAQIVDKIEFLSGAKPSIRAHHERFDGGGYPDGLKGEMIPLGARIIAVADSFDTMTTDRPYRKAPGIDFALGELSRCSGAQFDPNVVSAFLNAYDAKGQADH